MLNLILVTTVDIDYGRPDDRAFAVEDLAYAREFFLNWRDLRGVTPRYMAPKCGEVRRRLMDGCSGGLVGRFDCHGRFFAPDGKEILLPVHSDKDVEF